MGFKGLTVSVGNFGEELDDLVLDRNQVVVGVTIDLINESEAKATEQQTERVAVDTRHYVRKWLLGFAVAAGIASLAALLTEKNNVAEALAATSGATLGVAGISKLGRKEDET